VPSSAAANPPWPRSTFLSSSTTGKALTCWTASVSRADLLSVYERPDTEIWDEVVKGVLIGEFGLDELMFAVTVTSGIVTLTGPVDKRGVALSLLAAVKYVEGVGVRDRLSYHEDG
jgi:hypothetical protein